MNVELLTLVICMTLLGLGCIGIIGFGFWLYRRNTKELSKAADEIMNRPARETIEYQRDGLFEGAIDTARPLNPSVRVCTIYGQRNNHIRVYLCSVCFCIYINQDDAVECAGSHGYLTPLTASTYANMPMSAAMSPQVERVLTETINDEELDLIRGAEETVREQQFEYRQLMIIENKDEC